MNIQHNSSRNKQCAGARRLIAALVLTSGLAGAQPADALVGAVEAAPGAAPWVVIFQLNGGGKCPGALVHVEWVLTAGHCIDNYDLQTGVATINNDPSIMSVRLGVRKTSVHAPDEQVIPVSKIVRQPGFSTGKYAFGEVCASFCWQNDLVLLKLTRPAVISANVRPIPMMRAPLARVRAYKSSAAIDTIVVSSWGVTTSDSLAKRVFPMGGRQRGPSVRRCQRILRRRAAWTGPARHLFWRQRLAGCRARWQWQLVAGRCVQLLQGQPMR